MQTKLATSTLFLLLLSGASAACGRVEESEVLGPGAPGTESPDQDAREVEPSEASISRTPLGVSEAAERARLAARVADVRRVARFVPQPLAKTECQDVTPLDTCTWASAADAVVVATVRDVRLTDTPVAGPAQGAPWKWYSACSMIRPALEIELDVEGDFHGKISGRVTVHVGKRQVDILSPNPYRGQDGSLKWNTAPGEPNPLSRGQKVLVGLHYVKDLAIWSLMGEMISGVDPEGVVHVPSAGCLNRAPIGLDLKSLAQASSELGTCVAKPSSAASRELRQKRRRGWGDESINRRIAHPANYVAAECIAPDFAVPDPDAENAPNP
jgi:hypothetical protein